MVLVGAAKGGTAYIGRGVVHGARPPKPDDWVRPGQYPERAHALKADAGRCPDEADESLLEAADVWREADEPSRRCRVPRVDRRWGEDGRFARVLIA